MRILVVDDETLLRKSIQAQLENEHTLFFASDTQEAIKIIDQNILDIALIDLNLGKNQEYAGIELLKYLQQINSPIASILMTGNEDSKFIEESLNLGAIDYLFKPFNTSMISRILTKAAIYNRHLKKYFNLKAQARTSDSISLSLSTHSQTFQALLEKTKKLKSSQHSILIRGETGVGKDVLARYIWSLEQDESRPFIAVNCAAIPHALAESELFGHKKGAFSGAIENRIGLFEQADGGDLFLDELATLPLDIQAKLLRVLTSGEITPVGSNFSKKINCRIITATNENLEVMVKNKLFREDLLFRIKQVTLTVPALRERSEDIPELIKMFLSRTGYYEKKLSKDALTFCIKYSWPGNIRELKSVIETAALFSENPEITLEELLSQVGEQLQQAQAIQPAPEENRDENIKGNFNLLTRQYEQKLVRIALKKTGTEAAAAKFLGVPRTTLHSKCKIWGWKDEISTQ